MKKIFVICLMAALSAAMFNSCSSDEFGPSIFTISSGNIDKTAYTAPLDSFVKKCFLMPYNVDFKYKMEDISTDVNKNLVPATYDKCKEIAVLIKYLWYDVYRQKAGKDSVEGETLLKKFSPRIIHIVGSKNVNPNTGTEVLGETASGIMITMFRTNTLDVEDMDYSNEYFFKTMHHEFGHMLCSKFVVPQNYRTITAGTYDALSWQETSDSVALGQGYISQYSRNNYEDDFVEMFCVYLTSTPDQWERRLNTSRWAWAEVEVMYDYWSKFNNKVKVGTADIDSVGYLKSVSDKGDGKCTIIRKKVKREDTSEEESTVYAHTIPDDEGNIQFVGEGGHDNILIKFGILKNYLTENYNIDIDKIRDEVNHRSYYYNPDGTIAVDEQGKPQNRVRDVLPVLLKNLEEYNF